MSAAQANFLVLTSGNCGAIWFASALNLHDGIFAGCGAYHPIESCFRYDLKKDGQALLLASTAANFVCGAHPGTMRAVLDRHGIDWPIPPRDYTRLPWFVLDELCGLPGVKRCGAVGSVHAFTATRFAECLVQDPGLLRTRDVVLANMIRHPVPRAESFTKAFMAYQIDPPVEDGEVDTALPYVTYREALATYIEQHLDECLGLERRYGLSMEDPRVLAGLFVYRLGDPIQWVAHELRTFAHLPALRMEDLQGDRDCFARAVVLLTRGRVEPDAAYLDEVFRPENLGVGRRTGTEGTRPPDAAAQWAAWSDWERDEFRALCRREPIVDTYVAHGYDFSFLA